MDMARVLTIILLASIILLVPILNVMAQPAFESWLENANKQQASTFYLGDVFYVAVRSSKAPYIVTIVWNYPLGYNPPSQVLIAKDTVSNLAVKEWKFQIPKEAPTGKQSIEVKITDPITGASSKKTIWFEVRTSIPPPSPPPPSDNTLLYASIVIIIAIAIPIAAYLVMRGRQAPSPAPPRETYPTTLPPTTPVKPSVAPSPKKPKKPTVKEERRTR